MITKEELAKRNPINMLPKMLVPVVYVDPLQILTR